MRLLDGIQGPNYNKYLHLNPTRELKKLNDMHATQWYVEIEIKRVVGVGQEERNVKFEKVNFLKGDKHLFYWSQG